MLNEHLIANLTRLKYHRPKYPGETCLVNPKPYLCLPFRREDISRSQLRPTQVGIAEKIDYKISEGWYYSRDIARFVPYRHAAIDFALPYLFPVAAPCDGFAMSSYYSYCLVDRRGNIRKVNGKMLSFGIGYFVQIYNPEINRFIQLGHLSDIHEKIPFSIPLKQRNRWEPTNYIQTIEKIISENNPSVVFVKTGETVGYVGYSGLCYEDDYKEGYKRPYKIDPRLTGTWNIPHIHMDEFQRNYRTGKKDWRRDPYGIYSWRSAYPTHANSAFIGNEPLFLTDANNRPFYADQ